MSAHLPDLLRALAGLVSVPVRAKRDVFLQSTRAPWAAGALHSALHRLLQAEFEEAETAYVSAFVVHPSQPVLHLEASIHRTGLLQDPALLQDLDRHYSALGFHPSPHRCPDHLATELEALAWGLDRLPHETEASLPVVSGRLASLVDLHLAPLAAELQRQAEDRPVGPLHQHALDAVVAVVDLVREGLLVFALA